MTSVLKRTINDGQSGEVSSKILKMKPKMHAILMCYSGFGYYGMQINKGFKTIEGELLEALYRSGLIKEDVLEKPSIIGFQRASKTDKNVSAMGQVCSMRIPLEPSVSQLNSHLPEQIKVLDVIRTVNKFNSRNRCDYRVYRYICPSFTFAPKDFSECITSYRLSVDLIERINNILMVYKGTHNFHNFTSGKKPDDPSCQRYIMDIKCDEPKIRGKYEYISITLKGQSFMLHQIRKMIGLTIAVVKGLCDESIYDEVFKLDKYYLPKAPGLGLILDKVAFDNYNNKHESEDNEAIDWTKYEKEIEAFAEEYIFTHIVCTEEEEKSMELWLECLSEHTDFKVSNNAKQDDLEKEDEEII